MNAHDKKHSFFDNFLVFSQAKSKSSHSSKMKPFMFFLLLFSGLFLNMVARTQQTPDKPKAKVMTLKSTSVVVVKEKKKTKKMKKVVVKKETILEIDPANVNSPLYHKN